MHEKGSVKSKRNFEVIIVGAGSMGMATGYFLAKKGVDVLLVDSFDPPHVNTASSSAAGWGRF